jgi:hypothetical protein
VAADEPGVDVEGTSTLLPERIKAQHILGGFATALIVPNRGASRRNLS